MRSPWGLELAVCIWGGSSFVGWWRSRSGELWCMAASGVPCRRAWEIGAVAMVCWIKGDTTKDLEV